MSADRLAFDSSPLNRAAEPRLHAFGGRRVTSTLMRPRANNSRMSCLRPVGSQVRAALG